VTGVGCPPRHGRLKAIFVSDSKSSSGNPCESFRKTPDFASLIARVAISAANRYPDARLIGPHIALQFTWSLVLCESLSTTSPSVSAQSGPHAFDR
jgi:hypothetical protein